MTKAQYLKTAKGIADFFAKNVRLRLNLMGLEAALIANFGLAVSKPTLETIFDFYSKSKFLPTKRQRDEK